MTDMLLQIGLTNALMATLLALVAVAVGSVVRRPAIVHGLWLLVLIKLVTPPIVTIPVGWGWPGLSPRNPGLAQGNRGFEDSSPATQSDSSPATRSGSSLATQSGSPPAHVVESAAIEPDVMPEQATNTTSDEDEVSQMGPVPTETESARSTETAPAAPTEEKPAIGFPTLGVIEPSPPERRARTDAAGIEPMDAPIAWPRWQTVVITGWLTGSILWFALAWLRIQRFRRFLKFARAAPIEIQQQTQRLAAELGLRVCPPVCLVPGMVSPMLWSLGRLRLLLPADLLNRLSAEERETLLAHELAHVRRRDHWVRFLELLVSGLYWWHPVVWWARREIRDAEEQCCDAWVVWALPSAARSYANALLETVEFLSEARPALPAAASGIGHVTLLRRRVIMILHKRTPRSMGWASWLVMLGLAVVLLPLVPTWGQQAPKEEPKGPPASPEPRVLALEEEEQALLEEHGPDHPKVRSARKKLELARKQPGQSPVVQASEDQLKEAAQRFKEEVEETKKITTNRAEEIEKARDEVELLEVEIQDKHSDYIAAEALLVSANAELRDKNESRRRAPGSVTAPEIRKAEAQVRSATAALDKAKTALKKAEIQFKQAKRRLGRLEAAPKPTTPAADKVPYVNRLVRPAIATPAPPPAGTAAQPVRTLADLAKRPEEIEKARDDVELLEIDVERKRADVKSAETRSKTAHSSLTRFVEMRRKGHVADHQIVAAEAEVDLAKSESEKARVNLKRAEVQLKHAKRRLARLEGAAKSGVFMLYPQPGTAIPGPAPAPGSSAYPAPPAPRVPIVPATHEDLQNGRIKQLEDKVEKLQKEMDALKRGRSSSAQPATTTGPAVRYSALENLDPKVKELIKEDLRKLLTDVEKKLVDQKEKHRADLDRLRAEFEKIRHERDALQKKLGRVEPSAGALASRFPGERASSIWVQHGELDGVVHAGDRVDVILITDSQPPKVILQDVELLVVEERGKFDRASLRVTADQAYELADQAENGKFRLVPHRSKKASP